MTQYGFFFDQSRCTNCHGCTVACRDWNGIPSGTVKWLRMLQWEKGTFPNVRMHLLFATCYHCEKPACVDACESKALFKEDKYGAVLLDADRCKGARDCWIACPYGAPAYEDNAPGTPASKCTMCYDKLEIGELPICVTSCPQRALDFGPLDDMKRRYGDLQELEDMPSASIVQPAIVFKPMSEHRQVVPYDMKRALELLASRGDYLPQVFDSSEQATEVYPGLVGYDKLILKASSVEETLARSKNEDG
jgi:anaerobic dimethyl sulfoxide reductase subunit B (iron-sulfur subunit)